MRIAQWLPVVLSLAPAAGCVVGDEEETWFAGMDLAAPDFGSSIGALDASPAQAVPDVGLGLLVACDGAGQCAWMPVDGCPSGTGLVANKAARLGRLGVQIGELGAEEKAKRCVPEPPGAGCDASQGVCIACSYGCDFPCPEGMPCMTDSSGCDIPFCTPPPPLDAVRCDALVSEIDAYVGAHAGPCTTSAQCQLVQYPSCVTTGCFARAMLAGTATGPIDALTAEATMERCPSFWCGCASAQPGCACDHPKAVCLDGRCRACPDDCSASCPALEAAIREEANALNTCTWTSDCAFETTGTFVKEEDFPGFGGDFALSCGHTPLGKTAGDMDRLTALLYALSVEFRESGCAHPGWKQCLVDPELCPDGDDSPPTCGAPTASMACISGRCVHHPSCAELSGRIAALLADPARLVCAGDQDCAILDLDRYPYCAADATCRCRIPIGAGHGKELEKLVHEVAWIEKCTEQKLCKCDAVSCPTVAKPVCVAGACQLQ